MKRLVFTIVGTAVAFGTKFLSAQTSGAEWETPFMTAKN